MYLKKETEATIQEACKKWFDIQYPKDRLKLIHVANEGKRLGQTGRNQKKAGLTAGVSDLILFKARKGYNALCIEMKTQSKQSKQSEKQKLWQSVVEEEGYKYVICRSLEEFINIVTDYLDDRNYKK